MNVSPVRNDEIARALELVCGEQGAPQAFQLIARGELDLDHLLVARNAHGVIGAILAQPLPGASVVVWPPATTIDSPEIADLLVSELLQVTSTAKIWQTFLAPELIPLSAPLERAGFRLVTRVRQMFAPARDGGGSPSPLRPARSDLAMFESILHRSHEGSLDCPELQGMRSADEVIAGYRDCAPDLDDWWLVLDGEVPVGAAIVGGAELSFLGIAPEHRGRGHGRAAITALLNRDLFLIVDERNVPAIHLYESVGFSPVGERAVFLRFASDHLARE